MQSVVKNCIYTENTLKCLCIVEKRKKRNTKFQLLENLVVNTFQSGYE